MAGYDNMPYAFVNTDKLREELESLFRKHARDCRFHSERIRTNCICGASDHNDKVQALLTKYRSY